MKKLFIAVPLFLCHTLMAQEQKPNFLVIVTDDQTYDAIGAGGQYPVKTPNIDRLMRNGTTFTHAFNQGSWSPAVSIASRTMLITGQYLNHAALNDAYIGGWGRVKHEQPSTEVTLLGETFRQNGYHTFTTGKWHNSDEALLKSFDEGKVVGGGFYESLTEDGKKLQYHRPEKNADWQPDDPAFGGHWNPKVKDIVVVNEKRMVSPLYRLHRHTSEAYGQAAIEYLQHVSKDQPFFMYVAFNAPHDPRQSPRRFQEMYPADAIQMPPSFLPEHPFDQGDGNTRDEQLAPFPRTADAIRLHRQEYYAIISHADEVIGRILDELEYQGLDKNTYIIFTSDHGLAVGNHGLMGKQNLYDHTLRVPFVVAGPGIQKGQRADGMIYMQNVYATTCELAGIEAPATVDYPSIVPMLKDPKQKGEPYIWASYRHFQRAIRGERYKLILYPQAKRIQLFDLQKDPYEIKNLAMDASLEKEKVQLFKLLLAKEKELGNGQDLGSLADYR